MDGRLDSSIQVRLKTRAKQFLPHMQDMVVEFLPADEFRSEDIGKRSAALHT
jgi:hypothetical protein